MSSAEQLARWQSQKLLELAGGDQLVEQAGGFGDVRHFGEQAEAKAA